MGVPISNGELGTTAPPLATTLPCGHDFSGDWNFNVYQRGCLLQRSDFSSIRSVKLFLSRN